MINNAISRDVFRDWSILLIDDDPGSLLVAYKMLSRYGAQLYEAYNGQEGLKLAKQVCPKLIISDLSMPVMDGWTMIGHIRKETLTAAIPAIALTAHAMPLDRARAISAGFDEYLTKPLIPSKFINELLDLLKRIPSTADYFLS